MFNVRIIEYPKGYQVRVYDNVVGGSVSDVVSECYEVPLEKPIEGLWYKSKLEWDDIEDAYENKKRKRSESIRCSLSRTKSNMYYIARSNVWQYFITLTLDGSKIDRYDYKTASAKVRKQLDNIRQRKAPNMYYLIVPEQHKDGAWHFHGLLGGCDGLTFVDSGKKDGDKVIYNWSDYTYGFSTATAVEDTERVSSYIAKYITKSLIEITKGCQRYYCSKNCQRAPIKDYMCDNPQDFIRELYEHMTWTKTIDGFNTTKYFEIPKKGE